MQRHTNHRMPDRQLVVAMFVFLCLSNRIQVLGQVAMDAIHASTHASAADDPSRFLSRVELFNNLQYLQNGNYLNQVILRTNLRIGKRLTTRFDIPYVYNSAVHKDGDNHAGLGDINFRLLGYRIFQTPLSAFTASVEFSLNTASTPALGSGKNIVVPMLTYSRIVGQQKTILISALSQYNSFSGDKNRPKVNFSKLQVGILHPWSRRMWSLATTEMYADYVNGSISANLDARVGYARTKAIHFWLQAGMGLFGDFTLRYRWSLEGGVRYVLEKNK